MSVFYIYSNWCWKLQPQIIYIVLVILSLGFMAMAESSNYIMHYDVSRVLLYGIPSAILVFAILKLEDGLKHNKINNKMWRLAMLGGDASYSIYLSHFFIVLVYIKIGYPKLHLLNPYTSLGIVLILSLSIFVGYVVYIALDKPLSKYFKRMFYNLF
jgi:peptidoglycan/LPS O-acetylase OafA/YrhL